MMIGVTLTLSFVAIALVSFSDGMPRLIGSRATVLAATARLPHGLVGLLLVGVA